MFEWCGDGTGKERVGSNPQGKIEIRTFGETKKTVGPNGEGR